jgi:hypothetical protein
LPDRRVGFFSFSGFFGGAGGAGGKVARAARMNTHSPLSFSHARQDSSLQAKPLKQIVPVISFLHVIERTVNRVNHDATEYDPSHYRHEKWKFHDLQSSNDETKHND